MGSIGKDFVIAEWPDAGGLWEQPRLIAPWHIHHKDDEAWYVLQGVLRVAARDAAYLWNPGPGQVRYLLVMTSNIYHLITAFHAMPERSPTALRAVFQKYDTELVDR